MNDSQNSPPTAQTSFGSDGAELSSEDTDWLRLARTSFQSATSYADNNYRKGWDDGLRSFNNQHATDSKYCQPAYEKRSRLFRPKTRAIIRKNEAAAAAAFFSSIDVTSVTAVDQSNKMQLASADVNKALLQYRLTETIPWFQTVLGGLQDAQNVGVAIAHIYWDYKAGKAQLPLLAEQDKAPPDADNADEEYPVQTRVPDGAMVAPGPNQQPMAMAEPQAPAAPKPAQEVKPLSDKPVIDLIPVENLLIDAGAKWTDPIGSSPFIIHLMPMYLMDIKAKMLTGEWRKCGDGALHAAMSTKYDSTRAARQSGREDQYGPDSKQFSGYEVVWVQRHIHRKDGVDWEFYTLADQALLTKPRLLSEVVFHGKRPYVMGCCILETHKTYPTSVPALGKNLQDEANEVANQRIDNVKFVLNKKFLVKRGNEADLPGLVRNVPGGVVLMNDPQTDVKELSWPDVTASAYEEQSRIDNDMNDLLGNFSAGQVMADHGINGPARNMAMLGQSSGTLVEYLLRTFVETFVQPVLRQLLLLEQQYETDQVVLAVAAKQAKMFQKFGVDQVTDELLEQQLTLNVNVGMGATDPQMKLQKFMAGMSAYIGMLKEVPPGLNMEEVGKEIFGALGYQDGSRFMTQENPQVIKMQQQMQQMGQQIQQLEAKVKDKSEGHAIKLKTSTESNQTKLEAVKIHEDNENHRNAATHLRAIVEADKARTHEVNMDNLHKAHERVATSVGHAHSNQQAANNSAAKQFGMTEAR